MKLRCINIRPSHQSTSLSALLSEHGFDVYEFPTLYLSSTGVDVSPGEGWVAATSANSFRFLVNPDALNMSKVAVIGGYTGMFAKSLGLDVAFTSEIAESTAFGNSLGRYLNSIGVNEVSFLLGSNAGEDFQRAIEKYNVLCHTKEIYKVEKIQKSADELIDFHKFISEEAQYVIFATSSMALVSFCESLVQISDDLLATAQNDYKLVVIGPKTAKKAKKLGFKQILLSEEVSVTDMVNTLLESQKRSYS